MPIQFFFIDVKIALRERRRLKTFIERMFRNEGIQINSLVIIFCSDEYLLGVNRRFLNHDYYTDIITFNLADKEKLVEGEIYISTDRIRENALTNKVALQNELHRIIFHGVLHLCGFKDKKSNEKTLMTIEENMYLKMYFIGED